MAVILRYFIEFGSFSDALRKSGWRCCRKKVYVCYFVSWWVLDVEWIYKRRPRPRCPPHLINHFQY